jgi:hypothetical protein
MDDDRLEQAVLAGRVREVPKLGVFMPSGGG